MMAEHSFADGIIAGDFNLVLDEHADSYNRKGNNVKARDVITEYMEQAQMCDIWRDEYPQTFQFTWHRRRPYDMYARLDYMLINYALKAFVNKPKIIPSYKSNHSAVMVRFEPKGMEKRGPGFWKLNASMLRNSNDVKEVAETIEKAKRQVVEINKAQQWEYVKDKAVQQM